jgi:hypothetical protein
MKIDAYQQLKVFIAECPAEPGGASRLAGPTRQICHQKYPSIFFFSIDALASWSIVLPCRSLVVVSNIS